MTNDHFYCPLLGIIHYIMKFILGKKIGMSQVFDAEGNVIPVTVIEAGPCVVTQVKTQDSDGYEAVQIGFGEKKRLSKPALGHRKGLPQLHWIREFKENGSAYKRGDTITVSVFNEGDAVKVSGTSKGKGFQGVVKRHGFHGAPATHGTKHALRSPGSIGSSYPEHVFKGMRMGGRMGNERVSVKNLTVVKVDESNNLLAIKGPIPGRPGILIEIRG